MYLGVKRFAGACGDLLQAKLFAHAVELLEHHLQSADQRAVVIGRDGRNGALKVIQHRQEGRQGSEARAHSIVENFKFYGEEAVYYPAKDFIFYSADMHGRQIESARVAAIDRILNSEGVLNVVTTIDGCAHKLVEAENFRRECFTIREQDVIDVEEFKQRMVRLGYERMGMVEGPGQFSIRGGIIDVFTLADTVPVRIELWDDEVDSIRSFDHSTQRSLERVDCVRITPAMECVLTQDEIDRGRERLKEEFREAEENFLKEKNHEALSRLRHAREMFELTDDYEKYINSFADKTVSFLEYFSENETLFVLDEPNRLKESMDFVEYEFLSSCKNRLEGGYILASQSGSMWNLDRLYALLEKRRTLVLSTLSYNPDKLTIKRNYQVEVKSINSYNNHFEMLVSDLHRYKKNGFRAFLISGSKSRAVRLAKDLQEEGLNSFYSDTFDKEVPAGHILVTSGQISAGFEYPLIGLVLITESDIFGQNKDKKKKKTAGHGKGIRSFDDLSVGDYVIHESHGLGIYRGIEKITVEGIEKDYIKLEYAQGGKLYILATQLEILQKYADHEAKQPKINKLGSADWNKTKTKVAKAVEQVAQDLVELYAKRQMQQGFRYGKDTVWQKEFEEMFPYEETQDQLAAIEDTKRDMESGKIMDRLICGDVGFGKTEIAIRAAFKAVQESKQVAYLVPTTILAQQHYNTFVQRMSQFPVTVSMLSRFRTAKENKETIDNLKKGLVDVVIGTHRLLSKDVEYKYLGLLIIDEEQRFGVTHKEKIKKLKENVDVLTLSATPIPRTLHMSIVGIRDMSVLEEAPVDRMPIQTFVSEHNDEIVREAIRRELGRGGQVYYVYNRVKNIEEVASHIAALVPEASVVYAHGQMDERQLEKIMLSFINGEFDVLVSTTIIETGLDISNVNTIIIHEAEKLGLSQLYQLRGRVGRSNRTAYAFLLYKRDRMINEVAEKRLQAIKEFTDLGSGFKIAMKDLEIRGAGNVLGESQHGHMAAVGYDLYCKMLNEAVSRLKGVSVATSFETCVDLPVDAYIPDTYIKSEVQKFDIYKRIAAITTSEEKMDMEDELMDRFGEMPSSAMNLLSIVLLKGMAHNVGITEIKGTKETVGRSVMYRTILRLNPADERIRVERIADFVKEFPNAVKFTPERAPFFTVTRPKGAFAGQKEYIDDLVAIVERMGQILLDEEDTKKSV